MCGIAGILPFDGPSDTEKLHAMVSSIEHRGPDQKNIFQNSLGIFGFLRLKIIDLSDRSNHPLLSKDNKIQLIYNGEIFNIGLTEENINKKQLVERIQEQIPNTSVTFSDYYEDPDKRNYIVSNEKIESTGWKPKYKLQDGISELIEAYKMIVPQESSHYRNSFPLSYGDAT